MRAGRGRTVGMPSLTARYWSGDPSGRAWTADTDDASASITSAATPPRRNATIATALEAMVCYTSSSGMKQPRMCQRVFYMTTYPYGKFGFCILLALASRGL